MPNHFHLLLHQTQKHDIEKFIRSLLTRYSMYFNKKYNRVGSLFQGPYKSVLITDDAYLVHLSRYIHINPSKSIKNLVSAYSSYADYLGIRKTPWVHSDKILNMFEHSDKNFIKSNNYQEFVQCGINDNTTNTILDELILE